MTTAKKRNQPRTYRLDGGFRTSVMLDAESLDAIGELSAEQGISRSEAVRGLITRAYRRRHPGGKPRAKAKARRKK